MRERSCGRASDDTRVIRSHSTSVSDDAVRHTLEGLGHNDDYVRVSGLLPGSFAVACNTGVSLLWEKRPHCYIASFYCAGPDLPDELLCTTIAAVSERHGRRITFLWPELTTRVSSRHDFQSQGEFVSIEHSLAHLQHECVPDIHVHSEPFNREEAAFLIAHQTDDSILTTLSVPELDAITRVYADSFVTARSAKQMLGFMIAHPGKDNAMWLRKLYVSPAARGGHIATSLITATLSMAIDKGMHAATGITSRAMWNAGFCRSIGFLQRSVLRLYEISTCTGSPEDTHGPTLKD